MTYLTKEKYKLLREDVEAMVRRELLGRAPHAINARTGPLAEERLRFLEEFTAKFDVNTAHEQWKMAQKLACKSLNVRYVRDLLPSQEVEVAIRIERMREILLQDFKTEMEKLEND